MPKIYRKRYLPEELLWLKDDEILRTDNDVIITRWTSLKPRADFAWGISCYFLHKNFKISKFFDRDDNFLFYYCDVVKAEISPGEYVFCDLLADIILYPDNSAKVLDLNELAAAYEKKLIPAEDLLLALVTTDNLLNMIYEGKFGEISAILDEIK